MKSSRNVCYLCRRYKRCGGSGDFMHTQKSTDMFSVSVLQPSLLKGPVDCFRADFACKIMSMGPFFKISPGAPKTHEPPLIRRKSKDSLCARGVYRVRHNKQCQPMLFPPQTDTPTTAHCQPTYTQISIDTKS